MAKSTSLRSASRSNSSSRSKGVGTTGTMPWISDEGCIVCYSLTLNMQITSLEVFLVRAPDRSQVAGAGEFLVTPLHVFPDYGKMLGEGFVGLTGGPVGAVLVVAHTSDGITGIGSAGVGNGSAGDI